MQCPLFFNSLFSYKRAIGVFFILLCAFYILVAYSARGGDTWWIVDIASGTNVFWGDDAYRYFLVRQAWSTTDVYWFNFALPASIFIDGVTTSLSFGSQFGARAIKCVALSGSLFALYKSALLLGVRPWVAFFSIFTLGTLPLYFFVGMSFFGESWFCIVLSLAIYFYCSQQTSLASLAVGLLPLIRPEGIFFVAALSIFSLFRKDWIRVFLPGVMGGIYFVALLAWGPTLSEFLFWRAPMGDVYAATGRWYGGDLGLFWEAHFWPWFLLALVGLLLGAARGLAPILLGCIAVWCLLIGVSLAERANFEPRYLTQVMPILPIGFAVACETLLKRFPTNTYGHSVSLILGAVFVMIFSSNVLSLYVLGTIKNSVASGNGIPETVSEHPLEMETYFKNFNKKELQDYKELAKLVEGMTQAGKNIETLIVSNFLVFYFLDPNEIPSNVNVVYALFGRRTLDRVLGTEESAGYFARAPFFSHFSMAYPKEDSPQILYVDTVPWDNYPYHWVVGKHDVYLFGGERLPR